MKSRVTSTNAGNRNHIKNLKIGVIGTWMIGQEHIRRLTQVLAGAEIVAVSDRDAARAAAVAAPLGAKLHASAEALINDPEVQAVVICSWGPAHEAQLLAAIAAGKPTFCEKPLATTEAACLRVLEAEVAYGKGLVQLGFMRRFDADYGALKAVLAAGTIGAALMFHSRHRNASVPPKLYTSDMLLNDTLVHDADIAGWLLDDEVVAVEVRAPRSSSRGQDLRDPLLVLARDAGGLVVVEISVNIAYGYDIRGEISGEIGVAALGERPGVALRPINGYSGPIPADWRERFIAADDQEFREWLAAAAVGGATGPSVWDGYASTLVSDAALDIVLAGGSAFQQRQQTLQQGGRVGRAAGDVHVHRHHRGHPAGHRVTAGKTAAVAGAIQIGRAHV